MNKREFIESHGATCSNWRWSWSYVSHTDKIVIFGAWDMHTEGNTTLILSTSWERTEKGRKSPAYGQSREHIRLIEEEGYSLKTFKIIYSDAYKNESGVGPAKIDSFVPELTAKQLVRVGDSWYASDGEMATHLPEELDLSEQYIEGASKTISVNTYERNTDGRKKCIEHYGYKCIVCSFDFSEHYGDIGKHYIHVHHIVPLSEIKSEYTLNPIYDLVPICPNCHAMIHRTKPALSVEQLKMHLKNGTSNT